MINHTQSIKAAIKAKAGELGFDFCGIARADSLDTFGDILDNWTGRGFHGKMSYMERNREKRLDPRLLAEDAKSVIALALNYYPGQIRPAGSGIRISRYAYGRDYHYIIREKLKRLADHLETIAGTHKFRAFTDSAPVLERTWAQKAGLGACGKNSCLIIPRRGSFYFLGEIITSIELEPDTPFEKDMCGSCTRCIDACPTGAIKSPGTIDANRCISYLTIELKESIPEGLRDKCGPWVFGCDVCQEVCPHNRHSSPHREKELNALPYASEWNDSDWVSLKRENYINSFIKTGSPIARVSFEKLADNISCAVSGSL